MFLRPSRARSSRGVASSVVCRSAPDREAIAALPDARWPALARRALPALPAVVVAIAVAAGADAAPVRHEPLPVRGVPDAEILGSARNVTLTIYGVGRLDDDDAADLLLGELPTGTRGDERTEPVVVLGRSSWPASTAVRSLQPLKLALPSFGMEDSLAIVGLADVDGDGRDDIVSQLFRQSATRRTEATLQVNFSPPSWSGRPSVARGDVNIDPPNLAAYVGVRAADVSGDGRPDLVLRSLEGTHVYLGRDPWPGSLRAGDVGAIVQPAANEVDAADVTGDGLADLVSTLIGEGVDVALLEGRSAWAKDYDLATDADAAIGAGDQAFGARIVPDLDGDGLADVVVAEHDAGTVRVYPGGEDLAERLVRPGGESWSVAAVTDTFDVQAFDLTGDGVAELVLDRTAVFFGGVARSGVLDALDPEGRWEGLPDGWFRSGDVDGSGALDVLVSDPAYGQTAGANTGRLAILLGPRAEAPVWPTAPPTPSVPTATATLHAEPSATPTPDGGTLEPTPPSPTGVGLYLPALFGRTG